MKKYSTLAITVLILLLLVFIVVKWTKWDTAIILGFAFGVAAVIIYRAFTKDKKKESGKE